MTMMLEASDRALLLPPGGGKVRSLHLARPKPALVRKLPRHESSGYRSFC